MYPKHRNRINRIRKRQNQMFNLMAKKLSSLDFQDKDDFKFYLNILNQLHFLNKTYDELEEQIKNINLTLKKGKIKNLKKEIREEKKIQESIDIFKPLIFLHYHLTGPSGNITV